MDWSKTKTIFIVVFLILDIFLVTLFLNKYQNSQLETTREASIEDKLASDNIQFRSMPSAAPDLPYLNAEARQFSQEDVDALNGQNAELENQFVLSSTLDNPIAIADPEAPVELASFLNQSVINGSEYEFWEYDEKNLRLIYHQEFETRPFYYNINSRLIFYLNDSGEVISYEQTTLDNIEKFETEQNLAEASKALEGFYARGMIEANSEVISADLGYYTFIQLVETQVLTPTWRLVIEEPDGDQVQLFFNAVEERVVTVDEAQLDFSLLEENEDIVE